jgi:hypothetical protein
MSKQPAAKTNLKPRVSSGVPWWIWGIMAVLGGGIAITLLQRSIPEDPAVLFEQALAASEKQDGKTVKLVADKLANYPEFANKKKFLDGLLLLGNSRPLKAIDLFKQAAEEPAIQNRAMMMLGTAYAQADDIKLSVETFQAVLKADSNSDDARFRLASICKDLMAFDLALPELDILINNKYKLSQTLKFRGDIRFDRRQFAEAASDYEAAIKADKNNPANSLIAERLVKCCVELGDLKRGEEFASMLEQSSAVFFEAEKLLQAGELQKLSTMLDRIRKESGFDHRGHIIYGKMMLKHGTPEKAAEGLAGLKQGLRMVTRNAALYKVVAELARAAGNEEVATAAQQNVDQLQKLDQEFVNQLAVVSRTLDGYEDRLKLAELAKEIGDFDFAVVVYQSTTRGFPERSAEINSLQDKLYSVVLPLVGLRGLVEPDSPQPTEADGDAPATSPPAAPPETPPAASETVPPSEPK